MNTKQLLEQINKLYEINAIKNSQVNRRDLDTIKDRVADNTFRIAVVGEFSSGKSTFINALMGIDLLTHAVNETTATITRIHNVGKNDAKLGTCVIKYRDGKKITITDMAELYGYTTAQSSKDVANTVFNVSVYVHFMDVAYPIEIIDTPGLNGIADKHREITIEEVKKAHACIYLLSAKGITSSDADFIHILQKYQSKFIFVQNFIDQLNPSEGETVESKVDADKKLIDKIFGDDDFGIDYEICGISALKKLCSRDYNIKKLYRDDPNELTEEDRQRLDEESRFSDFERILFDFTSNEKYKEIIIYSSVQALNTLIDKTLPVVMKSKEINAEFRDQDDKAKRIEKAQRTIRQIESGINDRRKKLENFIISRDKENRDGLKEYSDNQLRSVYDIVCEEIDNDIREYKDLEEFNLTKKSPMPVFYGDRTANLINSEVIPNINKHISDDLSHLYDEALQRVTGYTTNFSGTSKAINIDIKQEQESFQMNGEDYITKIKKYESECKEKKKRSKEIQNETMYQGQELNRVSSILDNTEKEKIADAYEIDQKIKSLGSKPDVKKRVVTKSKCVKRSGVIGGITNWIVGDKIVYYDEVEIDDSEQREWIRKYSDYTRQQQRQMEHYGQRISKLRAEKLSLENNIKKNEVRHSGIFGEIQKLEGQIKREKEIYENALKLSKREFCENQKKRLKNLLENRLFDKTDGECTLEKLTYHIDHMSDKHISQICKKIDDYYLESVKEQCSLLKRSICENTQKLEEQYNADAKDISVLEGIKDLLKENVL